MEFHFIRRHGTYLLTFLIFTFTLIMSFVIKYKILSRTLLIFSILTIIFIILSFVYNISIYEDHYKYINKIIMYKKGYINEIELPKDINEDEAFRIYASKEMIKELDNYLKYRKSDKIIRDNDFKDKLKYK